MTADTSAAISSNARDDTVSVDEQAAARPLPACAKNPFKA
jgi:hypothetical protein